MDKLPEPLQKEELLELVIRLKKGDKIAEKIIIEGHLRLGASIALHRRRRGVEVDDLIGESGLAVAKAVRQARRGALIDDNITGFIIDYIKKYIQKAIAHERIMGVPLRTLNRWNKNMDERARMLPIEEGVVREDYGDENERVIVPYVTDETDIEAREILDMLPENETEKKILDLREQGYTLAEIEREIGYSKSRIHQLLTEMKELYDDIIKDVS